MRADKLLERGDLDGAALIVNFGWQGRHQDAARRDSKQVLRGRFAPPPFYGVAAAVAAISSTGSRLRNIR